MGHGVRGMNTGGQAGALNKRDEYRGSGRGHEVGGTSHGGRGGQHLDSVVFVLGTQRRFKSKVEDHVLLEWRKKSLLVESPGHGCIGAKTDTEADTPGQRYIGAYKDLDTDAETDRGADRDVPADRDTHGRC